MENHRPLIEAGAATIAAGAFVKLLPPLAAAFAVLWYGIQIWQSETGRRWRVRWRRALTFQALDTEDRLAFLLLGLGGAGVALALYGVERLLP